MVAALLRPRAHVPLAVALVLAAFGSIVIAALGIADVTTIAPLLGVAGIGIAALLAARSVFVTAPSIAIAYRRAMVAPVVVSLAAALAIGAAMRLERPDADFTFAGQHDAGVVLALVFCLAVGLAGALILAGLVATLSRLVAGGVRDGHRFAALAWIAATIALAAVRALAPSTALSRAAVVLGVGAIAAGVLQASAWVAGRRGATARPQAGPYRT